MKNSESVAIKCELFFKKNTCKLSWSLRNFCLGKSFAKLLHYFAIYCEFSNNKTDK